MMLGVSKGVPSCSLLVQRKRWLPFVSSSSAARTRRRLSVQELSWCATPGASKRNARRSANDLLQKGNDTAGTALDPIDKFGVIGAMARKSRIIGINGKLPWNLPADRRHFIDVTRNKVLIMGRRTWEEEPDKTHVSHAHSSIVVSTTLQLDEEENAVTVVESFPEALHAAKIIVDEQFEHFQSLPSDELACWVVGGERLYQEALQHTSAYQVHLTLVDVDIDLDKDKPSEVALFPAKYRWDRFFRESSRLKCDNEGGSISGYEQVIYTRKLRPPK